MKNVFMKKFIFIALLVTLSVPFALAQEYKVGTYNLFASYARKNCIETDSRVSEQRYWCNSASSVAAMISELDCDLLGVQEVCDSIWGVKGNNDIRKMVADKGTVDYEWILCPISKEKIDCEVAIAYKKAKFNLLESGVIFLGGVKDTAILAPDAPKEALRSCAWAHFEDKNTKKDFYFLCTQLCAPIKTESGEWNIAANKYNMQRLRDITFDMLPKDTPSIIVGDMNADQNTKHWGSFSNGRWYDLFQHYQAAGRLSSEINEWGTQNLNDESGYTKFKPDHICLHGFRPYGIEVDKRKYTTVDGSLHYPSNHFPVVAKVGLFPEVDYSIYSTPDPVNSKTVRIISSNIRFMNNAQDLENGWDRRKTAIIGMMKDLKPAVIGFQECSMRQRDYILSHCSEYDYVEYFIRRNDKNLKSYAAFTDPVMWDRSKLELLEWDAFYLSETPDTCSMSWGAAEPRTALWCHFKHKASGKEFIFINTHLDHVSDLARKMGLDVILDRMKEVNVKNLPMVMLGDLNAQYNNKCFDRLKVEWKDARVEAKDSDDKYTFNGFGKSWNGTIDYIWYTGFKRCHNYKVIVRKYNHVPFISDHYPIRADLEL